MKNQVQLIAYVDRLGGGGLQALRSLLEGPLRDTFGGIHLLPFFHPIDGADAGFDPIDHTLVDPRLGTWEDLRALSGTLEITADLIVNHVSIQSPQFEDYSRHGTASACAGMFLTFDRVFPNGATESELLRIYRPRPGLPFTTVQLHNGEQRLIWTTFTPQQIDIDVRSPQGAAYIRTHSRAVPIRRCQCDSPGRGRLRDQKGRHELLHDPGDVRLHRRVDEAGARARDRGAGRNPQLLS